jgi:arylsulfatase A-like enzyme
VDRQAGADPVRPNFVVINLDDARADGVDRMPAVAAMIAGGAVSFANAFVPAPLCCPSRASLLTGRHAVDHGTRANGGPRGGAAGFRKSGADRETLPVWLQRVGYRTGLFGKYLNGYAEGPEGHAGPGGSFYRPPGWDRWFALIDIPRYGGVHGGSYEILEEDGRRTRFDDHASDDEYLTDVLAERVRRFVSAAAADGKPFFAYFAPYAPHAETGEGFHPPVPAERHLGAFRALPVFRPPSWDEPDVSDKPRWVASLHSQPDVILSTDSFRRRAYESLLAVDEQIASIVAHLEAQGLGRDTLILLTSDNGAGWGEHRIFGQGKGCPYEECVRVPLVLAYPRIAAPLPAGAASLPILNIDIAPTLAELAGAPVPRVQGRSLAPLIRDRELPDWRTDFLLEGFREERGDAVVLRAQPRDGDRIRLYHGEPFARPRASHVFEFDVGDGSGPGAVRVPIGRAALETLRNLGNAVVDRVARVRRRLIPASLRLELLDYSPDASGVYWLEEVDAGGAFDPLYRLPDFFGVRDVANGYAWIEYESGERELYDLGTDPYQLESVASDPARAGVRARLEARLRELLAEVRGR